MFKFNTKVLIFMLLVFIVSLGAVSASNDVNDTLTADESDDNVVSVSSDNDVVSAISTGNVDSAKKNATIIVDKSFSRVATDYSAGDRGAEFTPRLVDSDGNPIANRTIQLAVNGPIYNLTTDSDGYIHPGIGLNVANVYTYALTFSGDDTYNPAPIASSKLTVTKKPLTISATNKVFKVNAKTKTVKVTLKTIKSPNGKYYLSTGKKLTLKVNGITYTAKSNKNNVVTFKVKLTKKGKYTAKITYAGDVTYKAASKTIKITVK